MPIGKIPVCLSETVTYNDRLRGDGGYTLRVTTWRELFRAARERAGSLDDVALRSGVNRATIHKIEKSATYEPGIETFKKLVEKGLGLSLSDFFLPLTYPVPSSDDANDDEAKAGLAGALRGTIDRLESDEEGAWRTDVHQAISALTRALGRSRSDDADAPTGTTRRGSTRHR